MTVENEEKELMVERWSKIAAFSYDVGRDPEILNIFQGAEHKAKLELLGSYGLEENDIRIFMKDLGKVLLSGWWVGHELPPMYPE